MLILVNDKAKRTGQKCLHRSDIDLAIALAGMAVANLKECPRRMNGNEQSRTRHEFFIVNVAGVHPRRSTVIFPGRLRRSYAHASKKRMQWNLNPWAETSKHLFAIEGNDFAASIREIVREKTSAYRESVARKRYVDVNFFNLYLEHVARLCICNRNGPGKDVSSGTTIFHLIVNRRV